MGALSSDRAWPCDGYNGQLEGPACPSQPPRGQLATLEGLPASSLAVRATWRLPRGTGLEAGLPASYIRKTPKRVSPISALRAALIPMASTRRVSSGSITPSSHSRAVE